MKTINNNGALSARLLLLASCISGLKWPQAPRSALAKPDASLNNRGFTFIEVILVVVVLGFIAISAIPKDDEGLAPLSLDAAARKVTLDIRYAQNLAMTTGNNYGFQTTGASTYKIYEVATGDIALSPYSNSPMQEDLTDNFGDITFQNQNYQIEFNNYGRPSLGGGTNVQLNYINNSKTIQITATSGYITLL